MSDCLEQREFFSTYELIGSEKGIELVTDLDEPNRYHIIEGIEIMLRKNIILAIAFTLSLLALFVVIFTDSYLLAVRSEARGYSALMHVIQNNESLVPRSVDEWKAADSVVTRQRVQQ